MAAFMMSIKSLAVIALFLLVVALDASARTYQARTLVWTCPTTRMDASPFSCATDAAGYDLEVTAPAGTPTIVELGPAIVRRVITADANGTSYRLRVRDLSGEASTWAGPVIKPFPPSAPVIAAQ